MKIEEDKAATPEDVAGIIIVQDEKIDIGGMPCIYSGEVCT